MNAEVAVSCAEHGYCCEQSVRLGIRPGVKSGALEWFEY